MASRSPRSGSPPDPTRQHLVEVRRGLFRLHKALIDSERAAFELRRGAMSSGQFLQALIQDEHFAWLRPFSGLIVAIDEALAGEEPLTAEAARAYVAQVWALVSPDGESAARYEAVRQRSPEVLLLHVELTSRIAAGEPGAG